MGTKLSLPEVNKELNKEAQIKEAKRLEAIKNKALKLGTIQKK
jgi:hypothetical protein